jgi:hypothetical protein
MKYKLQLQISLVLLVISAFAKSYGQARSGISVAYGPDRPFSGVYESGTGVQLTGIIKLGEKWALMPNIGIESFSVKRSILFNTTDFTQKRYEGVDLFYIGVSAKYCFNEYLFATAGPIAYVAGGNEDFNLGLGGNIAGGVNLNLDARSSLQISLYTTVVYIEKSVGNGITPVAGLKFAYVFNFASKMN